MKKPKKIKQHAHTCEFDCRGCVDNGWNQACSMWEKFYEEVVERERNIALFTNGTEEALKQELDKIRENYEKIIKKIHNDYCNRGFDKVNESLETIAKIIKE